MERSEMLAKAKELGLDVKGNAKNTELESALEEAGVDLNEVDVEAEAERVEKSKPEVKEEPKPEKEDKPKTIGQQKAEARKVALKLVRAVVTPMDKDKAELQGEIVSAGNSMTGMIKKYIPFGKEWHIPQILLDTLKEKKMVATRDRRTPKGTVKETYEITQYSIQLLDDLTQEELDRLVKENK